MTRMKLVLLAVTALLALTAGTAAAATTVPGRTGDRVDADHNGYPDAGVIVEGHYYSVYAYDANGDYYWDLGDGRVYKTVASIDDLDQATLTTCDYVVNYRGGFDNDPYMDSGEIYNHIRCHGYDDNGVYNYQIVNQSDPRYRGNPDWSIWGTWEFHVSTQSHVGNLVRPITNV